MRVGVRLGVAPIKRLPKLLIVPKPPAGQRALFNHIHIGQPDLTAPAIGPKVKDRESPLAHPRPGADKEQTAHRQPPNHSQHGAAAPYQPIHHQQHAVGDPDAARERKNRANSMHTQPTPSSRRRRANKPGDKPQAVIRHSGKSSAWA